jgi:hypothetical protein
MTDLPLQTSQLPQQQITQQVPIQKPIQKPVIPPMASPSGVSKEALGGIGASFSELSKPTEVGKDIELSKEVAAVGVTTVPTVIPIPQKLTDIGVAPQGANVTLGTGKTVELPLTDEQINDGLKKSITESWRWLSEWCKRRIEMLKIQKK